MTRFTTRKHKAPLFGPKPDAGPLQSGFKGLMATSRDTVERILEALAPAGEVRARAMFGEYGLYLDDRVIALICDNTLFFKDIPAARALMSAPETGAPYPGAKPHLIGDPLLDTPEALCAVARALADALPPPKPRRKRPSA